MPKRHALAMADDHFQLDPSVNLFRRRMTDDSILSEDYMELRPTTTIKKGQPVCFDIVGTGDLFLDP